jgi:hypothetical protein
VAAGVGSTDPLDSASVSVMVGRRDLLCGSGVSGSSPGTVLISDSREDALVRVLVADFRMPSVRSKISDTWALLSEVSSNLMGLLFW